MEGKDEDVEGKDGDREKMNKEAKEEESKSEEREVERQRERFEINSQRVCLDRLSSAAPCGKKIRGLRTDSEVESVGISWDVSLCVLA